jgi:hypothetical protein
LKFEKERDRDRDRERKRVWVLAGQISLAEKKPKKKNGY